MKSDRYLPVLISNGLTSNLMGRGVSIGTSTLNCIPSKQVGPHNDQLVNWYVQPISYYIWRYASPFLRPYRNIHNWHELEDKGQYHLGLSL